MSTYEVVIIGAGFAGAATARALVARGVSDVLLIEQEPTAGAHSSGRNAGMVRRAVEDPIVAALTCEGATEIDRLDVPLRRQGSFLLGGARAIPREVQVAAGCRPLDSCEAVERVPLLDREVATEVLETPDDGIVEVHALLNRYLDEFRDGGGDVRYRAGALAPRVITEPTGRRRVEGVRLGPESETVLCGHLVVAAGAWCSAWGEAGGVPVRLEPRRRHIVVTRAPGEPGCESSANRAPGNEEMACESWPWVWDLNHDYYFRPESAGLLWSPCDSQPDEPGSALTDARAFEWLADKIMPRLPACAGLRVVRSWAGHRTFAPDGRFLLGPDPRVDGWHWAAGLGGHGVTASAAVGRRVALGVLGQEGIESELGFRESVRGESVGERLVTR